MNIATYIKRDQIKTDLNVRAEAIETPVFDNSDMWFSTWQHKNRVVLDNYFDQLGVTAEEQYIATLIQYERQQEIMVQLAINGLTAIQLNAEFAATYAQRQAAQEELYHIGYTMRDDESSFSMFHDGIPMIGEI